nr:PREDICTED: uncharacterized protein LOC109038183 [Bemisia tabaci]
MDARNEKLLALFHTRKKKFVAQYKQFFRSFSKAKSFYFYVLTELIRAVSINKTDAFERLCDVIEFVSINNDATQAYLKDPENPLSGTNLVILACKYNKPEILKLLFGQCLKVLNILDGMEVPRLDYAEKEGHSALYYAISSNNIILLTVLFEQSPSTVPSFNSRKFDEVFSRAYRELKLKRVPLSREMESYVENKLLDLRFFSENSVQVEHTENYLSNIIKRIELVVENIFSLNEEYSEANVNDKFILIAKFIARNIYVLKRQLKSTYRKLPWEEIEFCLICFVSCQEKKQELNILYSLTLNKSKILKYLKSFALKLKDEKFTEDHIDICKLAVLPNLKRYQVIQEIIQNSPEFESLYDDYKKVRNITSLRKISFFVTLAVSANPEEREAELLIARALQVMGEYFKNTLESPKLSDTVSELLLSSLSRNTRKIIIDLRNALSHSYSLAKRTKIEKKGDRDFFAGIQKDLKIILHQVNDFLIHNQVECFELFLRKVSIAKCKDDLQEVIETLSWENFNQMIPQNPEILKLKKLEELMEGLRSYATDLTSFEKGLFKEIEEYLAPLSTQSEAIFSGHLMRFNAVISTIIILKHEKVDSQLFNKLKLGALTFLNNVDLRIKPNILKAAIDRSLAIFRSVKPRVKIEEFEKIHMLELKLFHLAEIAIDDVEWIKKLREELIKKDVLYSTATEEATADAIKFEYSDRLTSKIKELRSILKRSGLDGKIVKNFSHKQLMLLPVIKMLVLDIMSILVSAKKCLEKNTFLMDENVPLLIGKCLRDHLAHNNATVDLILDDPDLSVVLNAKKLASIENLINCTSKVGKFMVENPFTLRDKHNQELNIITNQEKMFSALVKGNTELFENCLKEGSDIRSRSNNLSTAVHFACKGSNLEVLQSLLKQNLSPNTRNIDGQTALHMAAQHGNHNVVLFLLKEVKLKVDDIDNFGRTPLHLAAKNGHLDCVKVLLRNNASTLVEDGQRFSPLLQAVRNKHLAVVKILMETKRNVSINSSSSDGYTLLHYAAGGGSLDLVNFLLLNNANVNAQHDYGEAPLHLAASNGHLNVTKALIQNGADVNCRTIQGFTPLHSAVISGHETIVRVLLQHGANPNICVFDEAKAYTPLHFAAEQNCNGILCALLEYKANADIPTLTGETPLSIAAKFASLKIVSTLLKHGVDIQASTKVNPLHYASARSHIKVTELLIKSGIDVNSKDASGRTPLHTAAHFGDVDIVRLLIKHKAMVNTQCVSGFTPLHLAVVSGNIAIIDVLIRNGADVNIKNSDGTTAIHFAALNGCQEAGSILISNNADINIKTNNNTAPLQTAIKVGHLNIVKLFFNVSNANKAEYFNELGALHLAAEVGNKEITEFLIAIGASVNLKFRSHGPLIHAVKCNCVEIVELLLDHGANVNENNGEPLYLAIDYGFKDVFEILLKNGAQADRKISGDATLLHFAANKGDARMVIALINRGAKINALAASGVTPLSVASMRGHVEVVKALIMKKADTNISSDAGPPLHVAVAHGHLKVVEILLKNGAKTNLTGPRNTTPLELAVVRGDSQIAQMLLKLPEGNEIDVNIRVDHGRTLLHQAALQGNLELVKLLTDHGFDVNAMDDSGAKPIHCGATANKKETIEFFLNKGLSMHEIDAFRRTPLHYAAAKGSIEVTNHLITRGANINSEDVDDLKPIHVAAANNHKEIIKIFLRNGSSYCAMDKFKKKPLEYSLNEEVKGLLLSTEKLFDCLKQNNLSELATLVKAGACVDLIHPQFGTPLHYAVWKGYDKIVECLLENHANPNTVTEKGFTPLHYAAKYSRSQSVISLLHKGAMYNFASNSEKMPLHFAKDVKIMWLLKMIDHAFRSVKNGNVQFLCDIKKVTDKEIVKAIMQACNEENRTLIVVAIHHKFPLVKQLKEVFQFSGSIEAVRQLIHSKNESARSESMLENLYENRRDILGEDSPGTWDVQVLMAELKCTQGHYQEAVNILNNVNKKQIEMLGNNSDDTLLSRRMIALVLSKSGDFEKSYTIFQEIYRARKRISGPNHFDTLDALFDVTATLGNLGKCEEAFRNFQTIFEFRKKLVGENHEATLFARSNMAASLANLKKFEEALEIFKEVHAKRKIVLGIHHRETLSTLQNIAQMYLSLKKYRNALNALEEVFNIQKDKLGPNHYDTLYSQATIAETLSLQNKIHSSLKISKEVLERSKALYGLDHPLVIKVSKTIKETNLRLRMEGINITEQKNIYIAASEGDLRTIERLFYTGVGVNDKDAEGRSPLHYAVNNGHFTVVKFLLENEADPTLTTNKGNSPLHTAVAKGDKTVVEILFQYVPENKLNHFINLKTTASGNSALHIATRNGNLDVVKSLLNHGAKYSIKNQENKTPLDVSINRTISALLEEMEGLFEDAVKGTTEIVGKLKAMNTDDFKVVTNARNHSGHTLFQLAFQAAKKHEYIVSQFLGMYCSNASSK